MENTERFLPIGSVVLLKGGTKKIMVTGFCSVDSDDKTKLYDYTGCIYPEGFLDYNEICLFNNDQIEQIFYKGYESDEEKEFKKDLQEIVDSLESGEKDISSYIDEEEIEKEAELISETEDTISNINSVAENTKFDGSELKEVEPDQLEYL